jgi:hypothetical protein
MIEGEPPATKAAVKSATQQPPIFS